MGAALQKVALTLVQLRKKIQGARKNKAAGNLVVMELGTVRGNGPSI